MKKTCGCGKVHNEIPANARYAAPEDGYAAPGWYWECECKSTLYVPAKDEAKAA